MQRRPHTLMQVLPALLEAVEPVHPRLSRVLLRRRRTHLIQARVFPRRLVRVPLRFSAPSRPPTHAAVTVAARGSMPGRLDAFLEALVAEGVPLVGVFDGGWRRELAEVDG